MNPNALKPPTIPATTKEPGLSEDDPLFTTRGKLTGFEVAVTDALPFVAQGHDVIVVTCWTKVWTTVPEVVVEKTNSVLFPPASTQDENKAKNAAKMRTADTNFMVS